MAKHGEAPGPVFDQAVADSARAAGLSDADIVDMFGYLTTPYQRSETTLTRFSMGQLAPMLGRAFEGFVLVPGKR